MSSLERVVAAIRAAGTSGVDEERLVNRLDARHRGPTSSRRFFEDMRSHPDVVRKRRSNGTYYWRARKGWETRDR